MRIDPSPRSRLPALSLLAAAGALVVGGVAFAPPDAGARERPTRYPASVEKRIELGRRLFYEPQLSISGTVSCASCHAPDHGYSDPDAVSVDDFGTTGRHSQPILDAAFNPSAHWDGEFTGVEQLITSRLGGTVVYYGGPPVTPRTPPVVTPRVLATGPTRTLSRAEADELARGPEHPTRRPFPEELPAARSMTSVAIDRLRADHRYDEAFRAAFGKDEITLEKAAIALTSYCYSIESTTSAFDRYREGDHDALDASAKRGMLLFEGRAGCASCHTMEGEHPLFTDYAFHNTGVTWNAMQTHATEELVEAADGAFVRRRATPAQGLPAVVDRGLARITRTPSHERRYKTPTLRDVARRGPYMHNGVFEDLESVVRWYAGGCGDDRMKDHTLTGFACTDRDVEDLVAFLESLSGESRPGAARKPWRHRVARTRLRFANGGRPMADLPVRLVPVGDDLPVDRARAGEMLELRTDAHGEVAFAPGARTHMRVVLPDGIPTTNSPLVPDTCREATIQVPIAGRMTFVVTFPADWPAPPSLLAKHASAPAQASGALQRTLFPLVGETTVGGKRIAKYAGWVRSDVPPGVTLHMPGLTRSRRGSSIGPMGVLLEPGATREIDLTAN